MASTRWRPRWRCGTAVSLSCWSGWPPTPVAAGPPALEAVLADRQAFIGAAGDQVDAVVAEVDALVSHYPDAAKYTPGAIL
ncbi:adenylosuccinate lyase domain protein [Mycobacterium xenopi 3993]|nr:adenylosuccinate lyase domain protein [Mycobacterium xenopi 3993]